MVTSYICLMKGSVWYHKIFFFLLDLSISNAQILMAKSFRDAPKMLQLRKAVLEQLVDGKTFRLTDRNPESTAPIPHFHLNQDYFHYPISNSNRLACKVHIQRVDTQYSCAVCGVHTCPDPCFMRYHTMVDNHFNHKSRLGIRRLAEPHGRPRTTQGDQENCITIHKKKTLLTYLPAFSGHNNFEPN